MKTLIAYAGKYGATKTCADKLKERLDGDVLVLPAKDVRTEQLNGCGTVILGGSVYCAQIRKEIKTFCQQYASVLLQKRLGLFICCATPVTIEDYIDRFFSQELLRHATAKMTLGGDINTERLNFLDRQIMKLVQKSDTFQLPTISEEQIQKFASLLGASLEKG